MNANLDAERVPQGRAHTEELEQALWNCRFALIQTVHAMSAVAARRDQYTARHQLRVAELSVAIGRRLGFERERLEGLYLGALVHDIGKVAIPWEILSKPGPFTAAEQALVQSHAQIGADILSPVILPWPIHVMVMQHHERLDGSGYPAGLAGEAILPESRIVAVADVFQSMCDDRPYRRALGIDPALAELERGAGVTFDADVVRVVQTITVADRSVETLWSRLAADVHEAIGRVRVPPMSAGAARP